VGDPGEGASSTSEPDTGTVLLETRAIASESFTICTQTTSLTFDLTSDQEKTPKKPQKKNLLQEKKYMRNLQESNRGQSFPKVDRRIDVI